ncbi:cell envelope-like function transcriptional attenuator common domain protein [Aeromicrobium marinum DSM 15272]|uniref:Cell envelope-like function transcriptional attenuator common domain protein n=1 Tax=Aeromicrobium marinum DSM 15272 TaxID=585531 RepID=E2SDT5_9ACTN|nr:LCP family protein [Aeromicrobium marinum]EFQ82662.1 cell envelope-like function transcriptional attenuator common domain protein [Aeromicrobium marinum DSM 15272]
MQHRASVLGRGYGDTARDPASVRFRRALSVALLTVVAPGSAQVLLGSRTLGRVALTAWAGLLVTAVWAVWTYRADRARVLGWAADADLVLVLRVVVVVLAVAWLALFVDAWRLASPRRLRWWRAGVVGVVYVTVSMLVVGATAATVQVMTVQRDVVTSVFVAEATSDPLQGRFNILLLGADSGADRAGLRPDSLTVVSIDADTGRIVLVGLPRNLQRVPFPDDSPLAEVFPRGYDCGEECLLNAVYTLGEDRPDLYPGDPEPGLTAMVEAVEGVTGLGISYHVVLNMEGFSSLVDAVGGVEVDVAAPIAKFGATNLDRTRFIPAGRQVLDGEDALWFARSRVQSDDFTRMARQKCLIAAMVEQLDPQTVLLNATAIGDSSKELLTTDLPASELGRFADLVLRSRDNPITTVSLVPPLVDVTDPDFEEIADTVAAAIEGFVPVPDVTVTPPAGRPSVEASPTPDPFAIQDRVNQSDDLAAVC